MMALFSRFTQQANVRAFELDEYALEGSTDSNQLIFLKTDDRIWADRLFDKLSVFPEPAILENASYQFVVRHHKRPDLFTRVTVSHTDKGFLMLNRSGGRSDWYAVYLDGRVRQGNIDYRAYGAVFVEDDLSANA